MGLYIPAFGNEVPIQEQIGQLIIVGFKGTSSKDVNVQKLKRQIQTNQIGGVIFYGHNIQNKQQTKQLIQDLKKSSSGTPIWVSIDQEGGAVQRLTPKKGFQTYFPSAEKVAKTRRPKTAYTLYLNMGKALSIMGFNLNFGTVLDLQTKRKSPAISAKQRSFSKSPKVVSRYAEAMINAHRDTGVVTAVKHFPGHGSAIQDTHTHVADVTPYWSRKELAPYKRLIKKSKVDMVMTAHILHKGIDPEYPATLSPFHINYTLRRKLKYEGVVITDDLQMDAIQSQFSLEQSVIHALRAGCDILLFANRITHDNDIVDRVHHIILKAIRRGQLSTDRVHQAYERVTRLKQQYL